MTIVGGRLLGMLLVASESPSRTTGLNEESSQLPISLWAQTESDYPLFLSCVCFFTVFSRTSGETISSGRFFVEFFWSGRGG